MPDPRLAEGRSKIIHNRKAQQMAAANESKVMPMRVGVIKQNLANAEPERCLAPINCASRYLYLKYETDWERTAGILKALRI